MRVTRVIPAIVVCGLAVAGCSWICPEPPPLFPVDVCLHTDAQTQLYKGRAHNLYVRVFPLTQTDGFSAAEIGQLLADPPPQFTGAVGLPQSRTLTPGSSEKLLFDAKDGQTFGFVGVAAGYYEPKGPTKKIVNVEELRTGTCFTVEFGPSAITGGAPAPTPAEED